MLQTDFSGVFYVD